MATKKQQAEAQRDAWNANRPTGYDSAYQSSIAQVANQLSNRNFGTGYTAGTDSNYQNYSRGYTNAAQAAARNAVANIATLGGGYGTDYASKAAATDYQEQMSALNNVLPTLRSQALNSYNAEENNLQTLLTGLRQQDNQAYNEYKGGMYDWESMRDYLSGQYEQASTESNNFWSSVRKALQWALETGVDVYDTYKGYKQQQWENEYALDELLFKKQQYADTQNRQNTSSQANYLSLGYDAADAGNTELANYYGTLAGMSEGYFDSYTPAASETSLSDIISGLNAAANFKANGATATSNYLLQQLGLDTSLLDNYNPYAAALASTASSSSSSTRKTSSSSSSSSGTGSTSSSTSSTNPYSNLTVEQLIKLSGAYDDTPDDNPLKDYMAQILTGISSQNGYTPTTSDINKAKEIRHYGGTDSDIRSGLAKMGYTTVQIEAILRKMG